MKRENIDRAVEIDEALYFIEADIEEILERDQDQLCSFKCQSKDNLTCEIELTPSEEKQIASMLFKNRRKQQAKLLAELETL